MEIPPHILNGWDILIIDDEMDSLEVALRILKHYGANVITASDGADGLAKVRHLRPRFIISDLSMPELDGWGFIYEMKRNHVTVDIPIIALTAHAMSGDRERAIAAGFNNYITKPLSPATFMAELLEMLMEIPALAEELNNSSP